MAEQCEIFIHKYMITNKQLDVSISSAAEQRFLLILILQRRQPIFLFLHLDMVRIELIAIYLCKDPNVISHSNWLVVFSFPTATICEIVNHRLVDGFVLPVESEL